MSVHSAKGSALMLFMVFLAALSALALGALETAWSGQRMISAYVGHQQAFVQLEGVLQGTEYRTWLLIENSGLEHFLSAQADDDNVDGQSLVETDGDWINTGFSEQQCGPLFQVSVSPGNETLNSALSLSARWDVCCETTETCLALEFTQIRRLWSRSADVPNADP